MSGDITPFPSHPAVRLTMFFDAHDHDLHGSLLVHLMARARQMEIAGATALEGFKGYGVSGATHERGALRDEAPIMMIIVESAERIDSYLAATLDLTANVLITLTNVDVVEL
jgi:PII-like signaling protein